MFLYEWHREQGVGTVDWWENMHQVPPLRPVSDRFMMNIGHDCPITGVWALFLCSCLLIIVRNKGIPAVEQLAWSMQRGAVVYQLCNVWQKVSADKYFIYQEANN